MTAIVGVVKDGKVWIGGDSCGSGDWVTNQRADAKVFRNGDFLIGFTSSFRMGQLLRYSFRPPVIGEDQDVHEYFVTTFVDAMRECFKVGGYAREDSRQESGGTFLVGYRGRLFRIESDYQVGEMIDRYDAVGCGQEVALGALFATQNTAPEDRIRVALGAAERYCIGVSSPFVVECV